MIKLCELNNIPMDGSKGFQVDGIALFAVRKYDGVYLYLNRCPHLGIELEWEEDRFLDNEAMYIQCSTHGALFDITSGLCLAGPCINDQLTSIACTVIEETVYFSKP